MESGSPPHYGMDFPIKQSFVMSSLVQPYLPAFTKTDAEALQMKKTSWKNIKKFIKALNKEKLVLIKEWGNEAAILDVDFAHRSLAGFQRYPIPAKSEPAGDGGQPQRSDASEADPSIGQKLRVVTSYKMAEKLRPLLDAGADTASFRSATALRDLVNSYVEREGLATAENRRLVTLDPFIAHTLVTGAHDGDAALLARGAMPRDALYDRVLAACSPYHAILREPAGGAADAPPPPAGPKPKAGAAPRITITLETRGGNKTATRVAGLAAYHVAAGPLAEELRRACAGSAGAERAVGAPGGDRAPRADVVVQGPQREAVAAALARRGVEARWIEVVDKTKKKKR
jgi:translation initiation factor 2D